ncbi:MAG: RHS repeat-associated core domain-containing protein, partial [Reichenbachiella sp.]|uniref:RHS repeat domain-containing protein n=1 Tax=Reichenbachiella sp. TaxID=2184521 RepID=UPI0032652819
DNYEEIQSGYHEISSSASFSHERLFLDDLTFDQACYLYIYTSMQSDVTSPVYFDDLKVTHTHSPIVSKDDYYPFGLTFNNYSRPAMTAQNFKYNGNEVIEDFDLRLMNFNARQYDPALGRFLSVDAMAETPQQYPISPYNFGWNNPIRYSDPSGNHPIVWGLASLYEVIVGGALIGTGVYFLHDNLSPPYDKMKASTLKIHNEGSILGNVNDPNDPKFQPNWGAVKRAAKIMVAIATITELYRETNKYLDKKKLEKAIEQMSDREIAQLIASTGGIPQAEQLTDQQFFGTINPAMVESAAIYDILKDTYGIERGQTKEEKAKEDENRRKGKKAKEFLNNTASKEEGTYIWNGTDWVLE